MRVPGHDWLFVIGDVNGRVLLTHMGKYQGRVAAEQILGRDRTVLSDGPASPRVTFTDPQVAAVGLTLAAATDAGHDALTVQAETSGNAGGASTDATRRARAACVIERGTDRLLGATIVGAEVADFLHAATIAVTSELTMDALWHAVPAFPTRSEVWLRLVEAWEDATLAT